MKFGDLEIENFLVIGQAKVNLTDRGLVLVQGVNEEDTSADSNGSGKSSIMDALCWVLFGETARGVSGDDVINTKAGKGTRVRVAINETGAPTHVVTRHRKHKTGKNGLELSSVDPAGVEINLTLGTDKLTQERLVRILGSSYDVFRASVYAAQEQMPDLPAMTDKQLKLLVEEAAGITVLEEAYELARKRLAVQVEDQRLKANAVALSDSRAAALEDEKTRNEASYADWEDKRARELDEHRKAAEASHVTYLGLQSELTKHDRPGLDVAIAECDRKLASVKGEHLRERELQSIVTEANSRVASLTANAGSLRSRATDAVAHAKGLSSKVGCPCDECQQPLLESSIAPAVDAAKSRAREIAEKLRSTNVAAEQARAAHASAVAALDAHRASMTDVSAISAQRASVDALIRAHLEIERRRDAQLQTTRDHLARRKSLNAMVNPFEATRASIEQREIDNEALRARDAAALAAVGEELAVAEAVVKVFGPAGVRAHILDDVTPFLNAQTARYLTTLSDGAITAAWTTQTRTAKGELREKFAIDVTAKGGKKFLALSGGEKRKVRIAAALALQDLVARRASKPIDLFIGDEIDDALDAAGLERLTMVLEDKAKDRGSVFIVSHNNLKDWIPTHITVVKKDGQSLILEAA